MTKKQLRQITAAAYEQTALALQTVYQALNKGQQQKLLADSAVAALFARYGVETEP